MNIKKLIPNNLKQEGKYLLYSLLRIPYNRAGVPLEITEWVKKDAPINFIDIGASKGLFTNAVSNYYKINKGILVEPLNYLIPALKAKFTDNKKFEILNIAISSMAGETSFYVSQDADVLSSLLEVKGEYFDNHLSAPVKTTVKTETLDDLARRFNGEMIDILKIDAQGAEHLILNSGLTAIKNTRLVYTEFSYKPVYEGSSTFFDLYQFFEKKNFRLVNVSPGYLMPNRELIQGDALFINNEFYQ